MSKKQDLLNKLLEAQKKGILKDPSIIAKCEMLPDELFEEKIEKSEGAKTSTHMDAAAHHADHAVRTFRADKKSHQKHYSLAIAHLEAAGIPSRHSEYLANALMSHVGLQGENWTAGLDDDDCSPGFEPHSADEKLEPKK